MAVKEPASAAPDAARARVNEAKQIGAEIRALADLGLDQLRDHWRRYFRSEAPVHMSRELIIRAVAYKMQEEAFGGLSRSARQLLAEGSAGSKSSRAGRLRTDRSIKPGTRLLREWRGRTYEVIAVADSQFLFQGETYRSLSVIARRITGTRWSGPTFFGLNGKREK